MSFAGKVVIVTGASSGIGAAAAVMFCREGASVALIARNQAKLKKVSQQCASAGGKHIIINADIARDADAERVISQTIADFGQLDILVNNAGAITFGTILGGDVLKSYDDMINVNLRAVINLTSLAAPHLVKTKGNIINISSVVGIRVIPPFLAYSASKAALTHFTKGAAAELAPSGVRVNAISPGPVFSDLLENAGMPISQEQNSKITALNRVSEPGEIAELILYLASDKARGITGSDYLSDNGILLM